MLFRSGYINWGSMHIHPTAAPGADRYARMDVGFKLHPKGYVPTREFRAYTFGRTEIQVDAHQTNEREDAYFVAPAHMKLTNYEPHMHANGVRFCLQAAYGRVVQTINCSGYNHSWVRTYNYTEDSAPLLPKGTILRLTGYFDNTPANKNVSDPRNWQGMGHRSMDNMMFNLGEGYSLSDEEFQQEIEIGRAHV